MTDDQTITAAVTTDEAGLSDSEETIVWREDGRAYHVTPKGLRRLERYDCPQDDE